jgi:pimeloyl-ACP methyl ester carboxylesterase
MYFLGGVPQSLTGTFPQYTQDYLMWHHFGDVDDNRNRDLIHVYRTLFSGKHLNARNLSLLIDSYIRRTDLDLSRNEKDKNIQCPTLILCGHHAPHVDDTIEFNGRMNPELCTWMKLQNCSMMLEEQPGKVAEALRLFIQGLGYSLSVFHRQRDQRKDSSTSEIPLTNDELDDQSVHIVENPIAENVC